MAGTLVDPKQVAIASGDYYIHRKLGLGFRRPRHWVFEALTGFPDLSRQQIVQNLDAEQQRVFNEEQMETLVAAITKYAKADERFGPCITVHRNADDYDPAVDSLWAIVDDYVEGMPFLLKDYACIVAPHEVRLSNCEAVQLKSRYVFEHERIAPVLIEDECIAVAHRNALYSIHLYDAPAISEGAGEAFAQFKSSLHLI
ncbi:MAG: hypothetical protein AAGJ10_01855 [Bacteroidota bacterium]